MPDRHCAASCLTILSGCLETMAFTHGDAAVYEDVIGVVDDPVHDRFGDRAAFRRSWINANFAKKLH